MARRLFCFGPFILDAERGMLARDGHPVDIGQRAARILHALVKADGKVVSKHQLIDFAWPSAVVEESNLSVQIAGLRRLLGAAPGGADWIVTVSRVGYRFAGSVMVSQATEEAAADVPEPRPSVAVLPFENLAGGPNQEYFADGITEDIITALSRFKWFFVISRNAAFAFKHKPARDVAQALGVRYVLAGTVRKSGKRARISAELVDARSAAQLWGDRYDLELGELFSIQDRIAEQVIGAIEPELLKTESALAVARRRREGDVTAWDLVRQGTWYFHQVSRTTHLRARELFREAATVDPQLAEAHAWLGRVSAGIVAYGWSEDETDALREGIGAAARAVQLDDKNPYSHYALAITSVFASEFDQAIRAAESAIELSPGFALGHLVLGMACLFSGDAASAVVHLERGLRLNPHDPQNFVWYNVLATALLVERKFESGVAQASNALKVRPNWRPAIATTVCCYQAMAQGEASREWVGRLVRCEASTDVLGPLWRANPHWREQIETLLQQAAFDADVTNRRLTRTMSLSASRNSRRRCPIRRR